MTVWDLHCHPAGFAGADHATYTRDLLRLGDRMGIERFCIYLGKLHPYDPAPAEFRAQNDFILQCLHDHPDRFFGFAYLNPNFVKESLEEFDRCVAHGPMVGIKLWVARRCADPAIDPIIARAAQAKAVIFQHTWIKTPGNLPGESTPMDLAAMAARHPETPIICGHTGAQWEIGIRAVRPHRNVSVDLAGSDPTSGFAEMAVRELGADRVIWGSDAGGRSLGSQLGKLFGAEIPEAARERVASGNLRRMMEPILKAKGIRV
ncbi:MAG: amidohydrolase family protein [Bryobacteraceae bacterium]